MSKSLSAYARQFLELMGKPDVDSHRGPVAGHFHRAEDHQPQPALHRRHGDGNPRLHAPALGARRGALFAGDRPADRGADGQPDGRPGDGDARGHAAAAAGAGGARPQGRIPQGTRRTAAQGLHAGEGGRQAVRNRRGPGAEPQGQARDRGGGGPRRGARGHRAAAGRQFRDRARDGRWRGLRRGCRQRRAHRVFQPLRLPGQRLLDRGNRAAAVLASTPRTAPARPATGWGWKASSTRIWWCRTSGCAWPKAPSRPGRMRKARITTRRCKASPGTSRSRPARRGANCRTRCATPSCSAPARSRWP